MIRKLSFDARALRRSTLLLVSLAVGALGVPAAAHAAITTFGSDLSASATVVHQRGEDTVFWSTSFGNAASAPVAPASGQIRAIRLKGTALQNGASPPTRTDKMIHFQTLRPMAGGAVQVIVTSQDFMDEVPVVTSTQSSDVVTTFYPTNMCVQAGDYVGFNSVGGFNPPDYDRGTPWRIFGAVPKSVTRQYAHGDGTNNGTVLLPPPFMPTNSNGAPGENRELTTELLMQMELGTGPDGTGLCAGGTAGTGGGGGGGSTGGGGGGETARPFAGLLMPPAQAAWMSKKGVVSVRMRCPSRTPGGCKGTLTLISAKPIAAAKKKRLKLGTARFTVAADKTKKVGIRLSKKAKRAMRRRRSLKARLRAVSVDGNGQRKITSGGVTIKRGRR